MVEKIIKDLRLSNLKGPKLRDSKCLFYMDENCGPNNIEEFKIKEMKRKNKIQSSNDIFKKPFITKINEEDFYKVNHLKENRLPQPYRDYENIVNPLSHFLSPGYNKGSHRGINQEAIRPIITSDPQKSDPKEINSNRLNCPNVFEEINRSSENDPSALLYNGRISSEDACRAHLNAKKKLMMVKEFQAKQMEQKRPIISNVFAEFTPRMGPAATEDELKALKFLYTSSTQKAYEDINFESYLHPRRWAPISTIELHADPIKAAYSKNKCYPSVNSLKTNVDFVKFESEQLRQNNFLPQRPHDFCSPNPNRNQIPSYSGCTGAYNKDDIDNPNVKDFKPFTVLRSTVPKFGDCVEKPVFVGYTGKIPKLPANMLPPFNTDPLPRNVLGQTC